MLITMIIIIIISIILTILSFIGLPFIVKTIYIYANALKYSIDNISDEHDKLFAITILQKMTQFNYWPSKKERKEIERIIKMYNNNV